MIKTRFASAALLTALALAACGGDDKNNNNTGGGTTLSASQRSELATKINIALQTAGAGLGGAGAFAGFGSFLTYGQVTSVDITTDLPAAVRLASAEAVSAAVRDLPSLQTTASRGYKAMGLLFHVTNAPQPTDDAQGLILINGFPITSMIITFSDAGGGTIPTSAAGAFLTFAGTCTSTANCTVGQFAGTSGTFTIAATGSSQGSCPNFPLPTASGVTCTRQNFNASFNVSAQGAGTSTGTRTAAMTGRTISGVKISVDCDAQQCD